MEIPHQSVVWDTGPESVWQLCLLHENIRKLSSAKQTSVIQRSLLSKHLKANTGLILVSSSSGIFKKMEFVDRIPSLWISVFRGMTGLYDVSQNSRSLASSVGKKWPRVSLLKQTSFFITHFEVSIPPKRKKPSGSSAAERSRTVPTPKLQCQQSLQTG